MPENRWPWILFAAAVLTRVVGAMGSALFGTDSGHFLLMADWFRSGRIQEALLMTYHPGFPFLTAVARSVLPSTELAGSAVSVLLGGAAVVPLYHAARAAFGPAVAAVTGLLFAFHPSILLVHADAMTEGTFHFFLFSSMWLTWRVLEEPAPERAVVLGACAAASFLTRAEGILSIVFAVAWPATELLRRREESGKRAAGLLLTGSVILLLVSPYLLWVEDIRGGWGLSVRPSAISVERAVGIGDAGALDGSRLSLLATYVKGLYRLTLSGLLLPFYLLGIPLLRSLATRRGLFYFSHAFGLLVGIVIALRSHNFMSERYLMGGMALMAAVAAAGVVKGMIWLSRRQSPGAVHPALPAAALLLIVLLPGFLCLRLRRTECASYPVAARRILEEGPRPRGMSGPVEQVAYLAGCRSYYSASTPAEIRRQVERDRVDCYVYSEKDVASRPEYVAMLRSCDVLQPPREVTGPPGSLKVYWQRVK